MSTYDESDIEFFEASIHGAAERALDDSNPGERDSSAHGWRNMVKQLFSHHGERSRAESLVMETLFAVAAKAPGSPFHQIVADLHREIQAMKATGQRHWPGTVVVPTINLEL